MLICVYCVYHVCVCLLQNDKPPVLASALVASVMVGVQAGVGVGVARVWTVVTDSIHCNII